MESSHGLPIRVCMTCFSSIISLTSQIFQLVMITPVQSFHVGSQTYYMCPCLRAFALARPLSGTLTFQVSIAHQLTSFSSLKVTLAQTASLVLNLKQNIIPTPITLFSYPALFFFTEYVTI